MKDAFEIELKPAAFANKLNELGVKLPADWRKTPEWKLFVAGWNACAESANASIKAKYNMGEAASRVFGGDKS